jgi:hypothetical protein
MLSVVMMNIIMLSVIMLNVVKLNVVMLSVVSPSFERGQQIGQTEKHFSLISDLALRHLPKRLFTE